MFGEILILGIVWLGQPSAAQISPTDTMRLLESQVRQFRGTPDMQFTYESTLETVDGSPNARATVKTISRGEIRRSGEQIEEMDAVDYWTLENGEYTESRRTHRVYKDNLSLKMLEYESGGEWQNRAYASRTMLHDGVRPDPRAWFLDGVLFGSDHFGEMLLRSETLVAEEQNDALVRIHGKTDEGTIEVWLSKDEPHLLRKAVFEAGSKFIEQVGDIEGAKIEAEVFEYEEIDGVFVPVFGQATYEYRHYGESAPLKKVVLVNRKEVTLNPDFEAMNAFELNLEPGTVVEDSDLDQMYIWNGNGLTPRVDPNIELNIDDLVTFLETESEDQTSIQSDGVVTADVQKGSVKTSDTTGSKFSRIWTMLLLLVLIGATIAVSAKLWQTRQT